jgi:hypothetical protein
MDLVHRAPWWFRGWGLVNRGVGLAVQRPWPFPINVWLIPAHWTARRGSDGDAERLVRDLGPGPDHRAVYRKS